MILSASLLGCSNREVFSLCSENKCLAFPESYVSINIFQVVHEEQELLKNHYAKIFFSDLKWSDKAYCHAQTQPFKDFEHFFSFSGRD